MISACQQDEYQMTGWLSVLGCAPAVVAAEKTTGNYRQLGLASAIITY
jgi:hypothetical protein